MTTSTSAAEGLVDGVVDDLPQAFRDLLGEAEVVS
jgi:hypothetical protein